MSSTLLTTLRVGTAHAHHALEAQIDFLNEKLSSARYIHTLRIFEAFVRSWEELASIHYPANLADFFHARQRLSLLEADLDYFRASRIAAKPALPSLGTPSAFFGAVYVMEGSTLGGQVIARRLESALQLSDGNGYSYFRGHGSETGRIWREFVDLLARESPSLDADEAVAAANAIFEAFRVFHAEHERPTRL